MSNLLTGDNISKLRKIRENEKTALDKDTAKNDDGLSEMPFAGEDDNVVKANTSNNDAKDNKDALD